MEWKFHKESGNLLIKVTANSDIVYAKETESKISRIP